MAGRPRVPRGQRVVGNEPGDALEEVVEHGRSFVHDVRSSDHELALASVYSEEIEMAMVLDVGVVEIWQTSTVIDGSLSIGIR